MFGSNFGRWRIGSLLGFPVEISWSFLLLLAVALLAFGGISAVFIILLAFGSVLLHELGHAVVARRLGVRVSGIELGFFGGAAKMVELPRSANHEIAIAAAGPAVSLMLAGAGFGLGAVLGSALLVHIGWINAVIAAFNLLPALPMDGGRILRALLTRRRDFVSATDLAVKVSRGFVIAFAIAGLAWGMLQLLLLAPLLWMMGTQEKWGARMMAQRYVQTRDGYTQRDAGFGRGGGWSADPLSALFESPPRGGGWSSSSRRVGHLGEMRGAGPRVWIRQGRNGWVIEVER
jgi:Zn-dependent protease